MAQIDERTKDTDAMKKQIEDYEQLIKKFVKQNDLKKCIHEEGEQVKERSKKRLKYVQDSKVSEKTRKLSAQEDLQACINDLLSGEILLSSPECVPQPKVQI